VLADFACHESEAALTASATVHVGFVAVLLPVEAVGLGQACPVLAERRSTVTVHFAGVAGRAGRTLGAATVHVCFGAVPHAVGTLINDVVAGDFKLVEQEIAIFAVLIVVVRELDA